MKLLIMTLNILIINCLIVTSQYSQSLSAIKISKSTIIKDKGIIENHLKRPNPIVDDFQVNDNNPDISEKLFHPSIGVSMEGQFTVIWIDSSDNRYRIIGKQYNNSGTNINGEIEIFYNTNVEISSLKIGMLQSGEFVLVWIEKFNKESHLKLQYYSKNAIPVGKRMRVNKISLYEARYPSIATNSLGELVVTWTNWHNGYPKVYFQLFSSTKLKKGLNSTITDQIEKFNQHHSSVAFSSASNFILAWCDDREGEYNKHIFAQKFSTDGTKVNKSRKVSLYKKSYLPIVSSSGSGDYIIVWTCYLFKYPIILGQTYSAQDKSISGNFEIESKNLEPDNKSVSMNKSGNFVVSWDYHGTNKSIFAHQFLLNGSPVGEIYSVANYNDNSRSNPVTTILNEKIFSVWVDSRTDGKRENIWANILNFRDLATGINGNHQTLVNQYILFQNYPNPFNPSTTIKYSIPSVISNERSDVSNLKDFSSHAPRNDNVNVTVKVYDILGREVTTLVNKQQKPGHYKVNWDVNNQPSGVYFYKLSVYAQGRVESFVETKKMILLR